jgi:hypothetical protein
MMTETASEFDDENTQILENDTDIGNPNNTLVHSTDVNIEEDYMKLPNSASEDCP